MLEHPKGYRPFVPAAELGLALLSILLFMSCLIFLCPSLLLALGFMMTADRPLPNIASWSPVGGLIFVANAAAFGYGVYVRKHLSDLLYRPFVWLGCSILLLFIWLVEPLIINMWLSLYWTD